jgi:hypothetical protein
MPVVAQSISLYSLVRSLSVSFMSMRCFLFIFALRVHTLAVMWLFFFSFVLKENQNEGFCSS